MTLGVRKLQSLAITWCCLRDPMLSHFETILACDRHTHTQTHDDG